MDKDQLAKEIFRHQYQGTPLGDWEDGWDSVGGKELQSAFISIAEFVLDKYDIAPKEQEQKESSYEYEAFFESRSSEPIPLHGWFPVATSRIKEPEKIKHYIEMGLLRKI